MVERPSCDRLPLISNGLYITACDILGPDCIVKLRRQKWNIHDLLSSCDKSMRGTWKSSGSMAEGFMFKSSDYDLMFICNHITVLDSNRNYLANIAGVPVVLLMETENVPPGFTLLRFLKYSPMPCAHPGLDETLIRNNVYYSSKVARESFDPILRSYIHGPCKSGSIQGLDFDFAYTLQCPVWPRVAMSFIHRSLRHSWPCYDVLTDICKDGCLLVPINSKQQTCADFVDLEWRISFSLAEKKLIHSMNHCQFLCYGLMKIFLNEVLKKIPEVGELLCSYFMKTAVFWEILEFRYDWSQNSFLVKFWNVFRRIMKWVSVGYCPNFFIPQHNMFYGKIYGRQQRHLMMRLGSLHNEGYRCLLRCSSLQPMFSLAINFPYFFRCFPAYEDIFLLPNKSVEERIHSVTTFLDVCMMNYNISVLVDLLYNTASLIPSSDDVALAIELKVNVILQRIAMEFNESYGRSNQKRFSNKSKYCFCVTCQSILRRTKTFFCYNTILRAVCLYRNAEYEKTIEIVNHIKQKLSRQPFMYHWDLDGKFIIECREQGLSYDEIVKSFILNYYIYDHHVFIEELYLEGHAAAEIVGKNPRVLTSPFVFLNFLLILCHTKLNETNTRQEVLCELRTLVSSDNGYHIDSECVVISWEILGICQQICGDYRGAYQSYLKVLKDELCYFKQATIVRIITLLYDLNIVHR